MARWGLVTAEETAEETAEQTLLCSEMPELEGWTQGDAWKDESVSISIRVKCLRSEVVFYRYTTLGCVHTP